MTDFPCKAQTKRMARDLPVELDVTADIVLGRWLAMCAHPTAAWRRLPPSGRVLLAGSYAAASYVAGLVLLFAL